MRNSRKMIDRVGMFSKSVLGVLLSAVVMVPNVTVGPMAKAMECDRVEKVIEDTSCCINEDKKLIDCFPDKFFAEYIYEDILGRENWDDQGISYRLSEDDMNIIHDCVYIDVSMTSCTDLTGIENFSSLKCLLCSKTSIRDLNVSSLTKLRELSCSDTLIDELDVSNNIALTALRCNNTPIRELDVSNNTALTTLMCSHTQITDLDIRNNIALKNLYCEDTNITELSVTNNHNIHTIRCSSTVSIYNTIN